MAIELASMHGITGTDDNRGISGQNVLHMLKCNVGHFDPKVSVSGILLSVYILLFIICICCNCSSIRHICNIT